MKTKIGFISGNGSNPLNNVPYFKKGSNEATTVDKYDTFMDQKIVKNIFIDYMF